MLGVSGMTRAYLDGIDDRNGNRIAGAVLARHATPRQTTAEQAFEIAFDKFVHDDAIVGASYVIVKDGKEIKWHSTGMADRELRQPVDQNTIFHWGSITKTLTAVSIMQLRDRGKLSLDDSIVKYF